MNNDYYDYVGRRINQRKYMLEEMGKEKIWFRIITSGPTLIGKIDRIDMDLLYLKPSLVSSESKEGAICNLEEKIPSTVCIMDIMSTQPLKEEDINYWNSINKNKNEKTGFSK